jgi:hypothetical protein
MLLCINNFWAKCKRWSDQISAVNVVFTQYLKKYLLLTLFTPDSSRIRYTLFRNSNQDNPYSYLYIHSYPCQTPKSKSERKYEKKYEIGNIRPLDYAPRNYNVQYCCFVQKKNLCSICFLNVYLQNSAVNDF